MHFTTKKYVEPGLPALQQLADGININGFLSPIRENPDQFKPCSINSSKRFTFDDLIDLIEPNFSPKQINFSKQISARTKCLLLVHRYFGRVRPAR